MPRAQLGRLEVIGNNQVYKVKINIEGNSSAT